MALASEHPLRPAGRHSGTARRPLRSEPVVAIPPSTLADWRLHRNPDWTLSQAEPSLLARPGEPLRPVATAPRSRFWSAAILASGILHAAAALLFVAYGSDEVLIEGGEQAQVALLGNAPEDQLAAGDDPVEREEDVTSVNLVTMIEATPVETVDVETVPLEQATVVEAVESAELIEPETTAMLLPEPAQPAVAAETEPVLPVQAPEAPVEPAPTAQAAASRSQLPEVLTAEPLQPSDDADAVPVPSPVVAEPVQDAIVAALAEPAATPVEIDRAEPLEAAPLAPVATDTPATAETLAPVSESRVVEPLPEEPPVKPTEKPQADKPIERKPAAKPEQPRPAKPKPARAKAEKPAARTEKPARKATAKAGSGGSSRSDARRGDADGAAEGKSAGRSTGKKASGAGNAAVSNYPGKIVSKLRRALRYPAEARAKRLRGEVQVSFTVNAGGGVGSVRVARSSGSPILDRAAVETVRRAAPFPAIPEGAGRKSWAFTVPLAFSR